MWGGEAGRLGCWDARKLGGWDVRRPRVLKASPKEAFGHYKGFVLMEKN